MIRNALPQSLLDNPRPEQWLALRADRTVALRTGKVEIGQGILTALRQIAAEELDLAPARLTVAAADTIDAPQEGYTAGSFSVEHSGGAIRLVCAEVRARLLAAAAARLGVEPGALAIADGDVLRGGAPTGLDYWTLADAVDMTAPATGAAPTKRPDAYRVVGTSEPRVDLPEKVFGAPFVHDLAPAGLLHARALHRPWPGARLAADAADLARVAGEGVSVVREGDFAAFVAEDEAAVAAALGRARERLRWEGGTPLRPEHGRSDWLLAQPTRDRRVDAGDDAPVSAGGMRLAARYARPYIAHASIGPSCALARFADDRLEVWTHSQGVVPLRASLARALGLDPARILVRHHQGAGCYGHNGADDVALDAALVARAHPGRPVRVLWAREDEMTASPFGAMGVVEIEAELDADGRPRDWSLTLTGPVHGTRPGMNGAVHLLSAGALAGAAPDPEPLDIPDERGGGATRNAVALYDLPSQRVLHRLVPTPVVRTSAMRGLGALVNVFAIESFVDELAEAAGQDPLAYRLAMLSDARARRVIEAVAALSGWREGVPGGDGTGRGLAFSRYKNHAAYAALVAEVEVDEGVRVRRVWAAIDAGLVINPDGAANQVEGGIVQATSWALKEEVRFEDGRVATATWDEYPILRFSEVPEVEVAFVGDPVDPPLGLGEVALGPTAGAIGNAVAHALGTRVRDLPLTRDRVLAALA